MECLSQSFFTKYQIYHIKYYIQLISFKTLTKAQKTFHHFYFKSLLMLFIFYLEQHCLISDHICLICVVACLIVDLVCHTAVTVVTNKQTNKKTLKQQRNKFTNTQIFLQPEKEKENERERRGERQKKLPKKTD